jgi:hypothetical protein
MYNKARPVNLSSLILDLNHVFSKRREEKLLSAVAIDIGRVIKILINKENTGK